MPICPGCEQSIPYDELDVHERYCHDIWGDRDSGSRSVERLERQIVALERRVDGRLRKVEADVERRLQSLERSRRTGRRPRGE